MNEVQTEKSEIPRWIIGLIIAVILLLVVNIVINIIAENILTTDDSGVADLQILFYYPLYLIPIIVLFVFLLMSLKQRKRGISQFERKHIIFLVIILIGFLFFNYLIGFITPTIKAKNVDACTKYANHVRQDGCIERVCNRESNPDICLSNAAINYNNPSSCDDIESMRKKCYCFFDTSGRSESHSVDRFALEGGDCDRYSNLEALNKACSAIKDNDKSVCEQLNDSPRVSTEKSFLGIFR
jgi:NADH:ubiquinone oxidoreductase subunit 6 (subunit J)